MNKSKIITGFAIIIIAIVTSIWLENHPNEVSKAVNELLQLFDGK